MERNIAYVLQLFLGGTKCFFFLTEFGKHVHGYIIGEKVISPFNGKDKRKNPQHKILNIPEVSKDFCSENSNDKPIAK